MNTVPIQFLHLETGIALIFLTLILWTQYGRARDAGFYVKDGRTQMRWLSSTFILMALVFCVLLRNVSPLLGLELAAGITLALLHPVNALCFMIYLLILRPWEIAMDNPLLTVMPRLTVVLCVFSWLIHPKQHPSPPWRNIQGGLLLLGFSVWLLLTTFKAPSPAVAQSSWFDTYFKSLTAFVMCLFLIESDRSVREVELTLVIASLSLMLVGLYQYFTIGTSSGRLEAYGIFGDPNDLASLVVMSLPFAVMPMFEESSLATKAAGILFAAIAVIVIWFTKSRGAMLALVAQLLVMRFVRNPGKRLSLAILSAIAIAGYLAVMRLVPRDAADMAASEGSRITLWKTAVNMAAHNPLLGVGFGQFTSKYETYVVGTVYEWGHKTAHSSWFLALGESGFVGGALFIAFFISVARGAWHNRTQRPGQLYALTGYGVAMSFLSYSYSLYYFLLMGLVVASMNIEKPNHAKIE